MSKYIINILMVVVALCSTEVYPEVHNKESTKFIVKLSEGTEKEDVIRDGIGGREITVLKEFKSINAVLVEFADGLEVDADIEDEHIDSINTDRKVQWINPIECDELEADFLESNSIIPVGIIRVGGDNLIHEKNSPIDATVAVIDSGIDANHPNLNVVQSVSFVPSLFPLGKNKDGNGHGTHVAGTIAAKNSNGGVVGVAPGAQLVALKVIDSQGLGYDSNLIEAIEWVTEHSDEIDVVNMSLGGMRGFGDLDLMHEAIKKSVEKGVVYVVAAGNERQNIYWGKEHPYNCVPASYPEVMTVSAMVDSDGFPGGVGEFTNGGKDDTLAYFSNYSDRHHPNNPVVSPGACIDVAAPGVNIFSTLPNNNFAKFSGTSMASPHVAGVVARYIAKNRDTLFPNGIKNEQTVYQIRQIMIDHAEPQELWNFDHDAEDPDPYHEGLIQIIE